MKRYINILHRDIITEIFSYLYYQDFQSLSLVNKLFFEVSNTTTVLQYTQLLSDKFNYSRHNNNRLGKRYAIDALMTCDALSNIIKKNFNIENIIYDNEYVDRPDVLPDLFRYNEALRQYCYHIIEEYYPVNPKTGDCVIYPKQSNVIGIRNIRLVMLTKCLLDIIDFDLWVWLHINCQSFKIDNLMLHMLPLRKYLNKSKINDDIYHEIPLSFEPTSHCNWLPINKNSTLKIQMTESSQAHDNMIEIFIVVDIIQSNDNELMNWMKSHRILQFRRSQIVHTTPLMRAQSKVTFYLDFINFPHSFYFYFCRNKRVIPIKFCEMHIEIMSKLDDKKFLVTFPYGIVDKPNPYVYHIPLLSQLDSNKAINTNYSQYKIVMKIDNFDCGFNYKYCSTMLDTEIIHFCLYSISPCQVSLNPDQT